MYEGKNIHYSNADSKLLCSFSGKLCNQRRLNGYGFCIRHILEDPSAPFRRCAYVAKSSNQMCTQAIPKHEERRYCNNHMQVLGMLPKKERKKKDKPVVSIETKAPVVMSGPVKTKFSLSSKDNNVRTSNSADDPDDPYTFSDVAPPESKSNIPGGNHNHLLSSDSILGKSLQSNQGFVRSPNDINSSSESTIAKYYPQLAEKLEKMRAKPEPKPTPKSRARSSRTMNKLQTKIAQNKINEKLRKSQEHSHTDSNSSPLQLSSPEHVFGLEHSPSPGSGFSSVSSLTFSPQTPTSNFTGNINISRYDQGLTVQDLPPLPQVDTSFLASLAVQDNLGFQHSGLSEGHVSHTPPRLPPPYPGSSTLKPPVSAFSHQTSNVLDSARPSKQAPITQVGPSGPSSLSSLYSHNSSSSTYLLSSSSFPSNIATYPFTKSQVMSETQLTGLKHQSNHISPSLPPNVDILTLLNMNSKLGMDPAQSAMLPSPNTLVAQLGLPPPPPYVPPAIPSKSASNLSAPAKPTPISTIGATKTPVPHGKLNKITSILTEKAAKQKLKSDLAVEFYSLYAKTKVNNHIFIGPELFSSDDDSEDMDSEMLPWQKDVFSASSDEDADSDELENDVPMGMRPTKISLLKTRLRRQWCQAKDADKINSVVRKNNNLATLALIKTARDSSACAVRALWQITQVKKSKRKLLRRLTKKKICCNKSEKEGQCQNQCLPYANHCIKHITYNINQQLFDFCTAKFANNVQCCLPSFDLRHELPLCQEHAAKADNYQKQLELETKKKPRKKSKPPALTRPPRKGKKKKKGRYSKAQKPLPPPVAIGLDSTLSDVDVTSIETTKPEENLLLEASSSATVKESSSVLQPTLLTNFTSHVKDSTKTLEHSIDLADVLSPDFDKPFELPLEQASRLLDESDFQEVVNKMPFDELDLFGKNGDPDVCLDLNSANKARDALEKLLSAPMSEEESMQLAMVLAQNLSTDAELAHNASLISEAMATSVSQGDSHLLSGADISHINEAAGLDPSASTEHHLMGMQGTNVQDSLPYVGLQPSYHQPMLPQHLTVLQQSKPLQLGSYGTMDGSKLVASSLDAKASSMPGMDSLPPVLTADLNAVYGQIESLSRSQLGVKKSAGLNFHHISAMEAGTSKTAMQHVPTDTQTTSSSLYIGSTQGEFIVSQMASINTATPSQSQLDVTRASLHSDVAMTNAKFTAASLPLISGHIRTTAPLSQHQSYSMFSVSSTSSSQPSSDLSYSLTLPSSAKKAKLDTNVSNHSMTAQQQQKLQQHMLNQQNTGAVRSIHPTISTVSSTKLTLHEVSKTFRAREIKSTALPKTSQSSSPSSLQRLNIVPSGQETFLANYSQKSLQPPDSIKLKLPTTSAALQESSQSRITKTDSSGTFQILSSSTVLSSPSNPLTVNTIRYSMNTDSSNSMSSTTSRRHNLLEDGDGGATESILVTVRQPSPLELVPTTVRHTLPDTFPTPMTLPSSALSLPLKSSQTSQWITQATANLQNGLPGTTNKAPLGHRFSPAGQGNVRTKQNTTAAEVARITALANAAGVPVVCSPASLPALVQNISTAPFKSSGSS